MCRSIVHKQEEVQVKGRRCVYVYAQVKYTFKYVCSVMLRPTACCCLHSYLALAVRPVIGAV